MARFRVLIALALVGCASHKHGGPGRVILENKCITSINVTPETYCEQVSGQMDCHKATVTYDKSCGPKLVVKSKTTKGEK